MKINNTPISGLANQMKWPSRRIAIKALKEYYLTPISVPFRQFRNGLIYFSVGLGIVLVSSANMESTLSQEIVMLGGLLLGGVGFIMAMLAQSRILISRLVQFYNKNNKT